MKLNPNKQPLITQNAVQPKRKKRTAPITLSTAYNNPTGTAITRKVTLVVPRKIRPNHQSNLAAPLIGTIAVVIRAVSERARTAAAPIGPAVAHELELEARARLLVVVLVVVALARQIQVLEAQLAHALEDDVEEQQLHGVGQDLGGREKGPAEQRAALPPAKTRQHFPRHFHVAPASVLRAPMLSNFGWFFFLFRRPREVSFEVLVAGGGGGGAYAGGKRGALRVRVIWALVFCYMGLGSGGGGRDCDTAAA